MQDSDLAHQPDAAPSHQQAVDGGPRDRGGDREYLERGGASKGIGAGAQRGERPGSQKRQGGVVVVYRSEGG